MTINQVSVYSGTTPDKLTQTRNVFQAACDDTIGYLVDTLVPSVNTTVSQINTASTAISTSESNALASEISAEASKNYASQWASAAIGTTVNDGVNPQSESAYSWAQKTMQGERFTATSNTSLALSTGSKTLTLAETYRSFAAGSEVTIAKTSAPTTQYMSGIVTSYTQATNQLIVNISEVTGSGTLTGWSVSMRAAGSALTVGGLTADYLLDPRNHSAGGATEGQTMLFKSGAWVAGNTFAYETRTSNTQLTVSDLNKFISITSGTFTQTFAAAATLGASWTIVIKNNGSGDITLDPNGSETIDGLTTFIMYPGEARRIWSNGTSLYSLVLNTFYKKFVTSGTFTKPPGYKSFKGLLWGAGASGSRYATRTTAAGGGGGGCVPFDVDASIISQSSSVVIGSGGASKTTDGVGNVGGSSSFLSIIATGGQSSDQYGTGGSLSGVESRQAPECLAGAQNTTGTTGLSSVWGGSASFCSSATHGVGGALYGGAAGGGLNATTGPFAGGTSIFGGNGSAAGTDTTNGGTGVAPGGGGGAYSGGSGSSGAGARGQLDIWGII